MFGIRVNLWLRAVVLMFIVGITIELVTTNAEARAGRGRSSGRSSSFGSRQSSPPPQQSAPNYGNSNYGNPNPGANPALGNRGGFMRNMAGGLAGGFLGSMLFSSLGHASGGVGGMGGGGGGLGLLEIGLLAGLAFFGFKWWKNRQQQATSFAGTAQRSNSAGYNSGSLGRMETLGAHQYRGLAPAGIDSDNASDIFFRIQGAWTRRDLTSVRNLIGTEMWDILARDVAELKENHEINRLENISVRRTEVINSWQEDGSDFSTVRFTANLLDYTTDERTGKVTGGSDVEPVKFEEDWTFARLRNGDSWQLSGIQQV